MHPFDTNNAFAIGDTVNQMSETLLDGSPNATWDGRTAYSPPQDAVQEVRVKAFDADAAFGHTGGGTINQVMNFFNKRAPIRVLTYLMTPDTI